MKELVGTVANAIEPTEFMPCKQLVPDVFVGRKTSRRDFLRALGGGSTAVFLPAMMRASGRTFAIENGAFVLDGRPFSFISGEMHYPRIPRAHWQHRLRMARAMGLNAISTYVFWNVHEPEPQTYDFSGQNDVAAYLRTAQEEGLHVILRPGPYICGEWEFGGLPAWLLRDPQTQCRTRDPRFMQPVRRWLLRLGQELAGLQYPRGGPILAVAIENEYGSFGDDREYMREIYNAIADAGFDEAVRYTEDGIDEVGAGSLPSLPIAGSIGDVRADFAALARLRPGNPIMAGEYYPGWFDHWGEPHHVTDGAAQARDVEWMLANGSFSLYVFHGGTNWFMNGANYSDSDPYQPTTTSYDYDAPLDEAGRPRPKYFAMRAAIAQHTGIPSATLPPAPKFVSVPDFVLDESAALAQVLGPSIPSDLPLNMESYGQSYGYILYRVHVTGVKTATLVAEDVRDYGVVLVDGNVAGTIDRRLRNDPIALQFGNAGGTLDILVENSGRLNYGKEFIHDRKGILGPVTLDDKQLTGWSVYTLPMSDLATVRFARADFDAPAFYRGHFTLDETGDTFLDVRMLGKGLLWVNGHPVGRFWEIGPQYALYVPAAFLRAGSNEVVAFDLLQRDKRILRGGTQQLYAPIAD